MGFTDDGVQVTIKRERHKHFSRFFAKVDRPCYCNDVSDLFRAIVNPYSAAESRLFIDSSSKRLKAALLHNGNKNPSLPLAHSHFEDYCSVKFLLETLNYNKYG